MENGKKELKLGFGLMRLPRNGGSIDVEQVKEMVDNFDFGDESSGTGKGGTDGESGSELDLDTAAAEESLEAFREKASEPISISLDASDSLGEGNDQSGKLNMDLTEARANLESFRKDASKPVSMRIQSATALSGRLICGKRDV